MVILFLFVIDTHEVHWSQCLYAISRIIKDAYVGNRLVFVTSAGPWFNIKTSSYQYRKSHCGDKTILRPSYLHNGISYTGKMTSLYWIGPLVFPLQCDVFVWPLVDIAIDPVCQEAAVEFNKSFRKPFRLEFSNCYLNCHNYLYDRGMRSAKYGENTLHSLFGCWVLFSSRIGWQTMYI